MELERCAVPLLQFMMLGELYYKMMIDTNFQEITQQRYPEWIPHLGCGRDLTEVFNNKV